MKVHGWPAEKLAAAVVGAEISGWKYDRSAVSNGQNGNLATEVL